MNLHKTLCQKLYQEVKTKLQEAFVQRGLTFRGSETAIWKLTESKSEKTYVQLIVEEATGKKFMGSFNAMYLWKKQNETVGRETVNFLDDYLIVYTKFLGYETPYDYIKAFSMTLHQFFGIKKAGDIYVVQPIFDARKFLSEAGEKMPLPSEQTVDSRDTECLLQIYELFHEYSQTLPKRLYDQDLLKKNAVGELRFDESVLDLSKINCFFSIGFYSNYFSKWVLDNQTNCCVEYVEEPVVKFRIKYFNGRTHVWTDYYQASDAFDVGFLMKFPVQFKSEIINSYFLCGIQNKATKATTDFLCRNWKEIPEKFDFERNEPVGDRPFVMIFRVNRADVNEFYCEKTIVLETNASKIVACC